MLAVIHAFEVLVREGDGWHPRSECHCVHLVHGPQVLLPGAVGAPFLGEAAGYGVYNLLVTSSVGRVILAGRIVPPRLLVVSVVSVISTVLG